MDLGEAYDHVISDGSARSISTHPCMRKSQTPLQLDRLRQRERAIANAVAARLNESMVDLAIISRRGSNLGSRRFDTEAPTYTHMAFAVFSEGQWYLDHLLNTHGGNSGHLYRQRLIDFFCDDPYDYGTGVIVPSRTLQQRIIRTLLSSTRERLYHRHYSCIAYPFSTKYQNSNQWLAEVIGAAQSGLDDRRSVQQYLRESGLQPTVMRLPVAKQIAAPWVTRNTRVADQPIPLRTTGRVGFLMEPAIRAYLEKTDQIALHCHVESPAEITRDHLDFAIAA